MSMVATWYGAVFLSSELSFKYGFVTILTQGVFWYITALLFGFFLSKKINKLQLFTLPGVLANAYGNYAGIISGFIIFLMLNIAPYVLSMGLLLEHGFGLERGTAILIGAAIPLLYTLRGSFQTIILTDIIQFILMFAAPLVLLNACFDKFGGVEFLKNNVEASHLTMTGEMPVTQIIAWFVLACWTFVDPNFYQRCFAADKANNIKWGVLAAVAFWLVFDVMITTLGVYAFATIPDADPLFSILDLSQSVLDSGTHGFVLLAFAAIIMSTLDSFAFVTGMVFSLDIYHRIKDMKRLNKLYNDRTIAENSKMSFTVMMFSSDADRKRIVLVSKIGILLGAALAIVIALYNTSIIEIIYTLGSIGVGSLLIPSVLATYLDRRKNYLGTVSILFAFIAASLWVLYNGLFARGTDYFLGIEPVYVGLLVSGGISFLGLPFAPYAKVIGLEPEANVEDDRESIPADSKILQDEEYYNPEQSKDIRL
jgi:SSS family solute:Na+ symporter